MAIPNKYKNTLDDLIYSSDIESLNHSNSSNRPRLIDKGSHNALKSRSGLPTFLEESRLNDNVSITSLEPTLKILDFQIYQLYNIAIFDAKSGRVQYKKGQWDREDGKGKRNKKDGEGERNGKGH